MADYSSPLSIGGPCRPSMRPRRNSASPLSIWSFGPRPTRAWAAYTHLSMNCCPCSKGGKGDHLNNIDLGRNGRWRSNLWVYPGASSIGSDAHKGLRDHPTVKPTTLLADALLDVTARGDIVIDPFLGSGSTLIAAERTGRRCRGVEIDPLYVDVIASGAIRPRRDARRSLRPPASLSPLWRRA